MRLRNTGVAMVVFAVTSALAQSTPPVGGPLTSQGRAKVGRMGMYSAGGSKATAAQTPAMLHRRMEDMQSTLAKMHTVLKQMRAQAPKGGAKDPVAAANLDMWELMLSHLDKQLDELRATTLAREDLEARRAALYKQADAKAALAAKTALGAGAAPSAAVAVQGAAPIPAGTSAATPTTSAAQREPSTTSPPN
jgi:hypothetical protein